MKRLIRPKNSIRISALALEPIDNTEKTLFCKNRKTRYYLVACKEDSCELFLNDKQEILQKNQAIVVAPNTKCIIKGDAEKLYSVIAFDGILNKVSFCGRVLNFSSLSGSIYKELLLKLKSKNAFKEKEILLIISMFEYFLNSLEVSLISTKAKSNDYAIFTEGVRYIKENLDKDISIRTLANFLCVSPSKLKRVFSKYSALSLHKFVLAVKTEKAKELLKSGLSSKEVSRRLGFDNQNYFSAVFKRETGKSPSAFCNGGNE